MKRIDTAGRDVTNLPGLWDESDTVMQSKIEHWGVTCYINCQHVLTIESNSVCGRQLSDSDIEAIRNMAEHLLAFVGDSKEPRRDFVTGEPEEIKSTGNRT